ncbi:PREDICTED: homeobox protein DBX1-like [Branchiostoma belcheri]|uniref:Homeobox protein DBX1-like n=1 Tax=Branchiostoma belcheri TaxID=7741 RepID=A0A6P4YG48_BRABE|nr:PREDICTED: homeobox protein DBX1-like [Branchiostoma belcheri]
MYQGVFSPVAFPAQPTVFRPTITFPPPLQPATTCSTPFYMDDILRGYHTHAGGCYLPSLPPISTANGPTSLRSSPYELSHTNGCISTRKFAGVNASSPHHNGNNGTFLKFGVNAILSGKQGSPTSPSVEGCRCAFCPQPRTYPPAETYLSPVNKVPYAESPTTFPIFSGCHWGAPPGLHRGKPRRGMLRRAVFSDFQRKSLEKMFQKQKYISKQDRRKLAEKLGLKDSQVKIWFQNRRMKWRNSKERELLSTGGSRESTIPNKANPNPDLSDVGQTTTGGTSPLIGSPSPSVTDQKSPPSSPESPGNEEPADSENEK